MRTMRKGFFHVLEVVIAAMLVFVILTQLYSVPKGSQPWDVAKLNVMSNDILYSAEASGVDWFSTAEVGNAIGSVLPSTMGYAVSVRQDVRPVMRIGCVCDNENYALMEAIFIDFNLNGIDRDFILSRISPGSLDLSNTSADYQNDAILLCGSQAFTDGEIDDIERYLSTGKGLVELSDLGETQMQASGRWYGEVMNLKWVADSVNIASSRTFFPYMDPDERRYPAQKIFLAIPPALPFSSFSNFGGETVYPADNAAEKNVVIQDSYYIGGDLNGKEVPLSVIDWGVNGSGRIAWMSNASISGPGGAEDDVNAGKLLKSLVTWSASGREYVIVSGMMSTGSGASMRKVYIGDMYEPVRIDLRIGYHY